MAGATLVDSACNGRSTCVKGNYTPHAYDPKHNQSAKQKRNTFGSEKSMFFNVVFLGRVV